MEWLVTLSICPPPILMSNFNLSLGDDYPPLGAKQKGTPQTFEIMTFRVTSEAEVAKLIAAWERYFGQHYPKVKLGKPYVTPCSGD